MRDIEKAITDYNKKFSNSKKGCFYLRDIRKIHDMSNGDIYECINNALSAGFMVGYRLAKREKSAATCGK